MAFALWYQGMHSDTGVGYIGMRDVEMLARSIMG
jgi:hypothetical protein